MERSLLPTPIIKMFSQIRITFLFGSLKIQTIFGHNFDRKATETTQETTQMYHLIGWQALPSPASGDCLAQRGRKERSKRIISST
jgi:hypothetical protein